MRKVVIIDTSILCVWLKVPGKESCGPETQRWDYNKVSRKIDAEIRDKSTLVLPIATIIETGNHIAQASSKQWECGNELANLMIKTSNEVSPWAAFSNQNELWSSEKLKELANEWPTLAVQNISLGDATIKDVAGYYHSMNYRVEILTGDVGLKSFEPAVISEQPRRRK